jgi:DNA-binding MarR family transcriptional regulator
VAVVNSGTSLTTQDGAVLDRVDGARRRPAADELHAWRSFLRAHATVVRRLEADLVAAHGLPLAVYDVLVQLVEAPGHRLRMTELAGRVLLSRSGLTRLVDRMVRDGCVRREPDPQDARGVLAVLTDAGFERLKEASPTHLDGITRYVVDRLSAEQLSAWGSASECLAEPASEGGAEPASDAGPALPSQPEGAVAGA